MSQTTFLLQEPTKEKRICAECKTDKTFINYRNYECWYTYLDNNWLCKKCYERSRRRLITSEKNTDQENTADSKIRKVITNIRKARSWNDRDSLDIYGQILEILCYQKTIGKHDRYSRMTEVISLRKIKIAIGMASCNFKRYINRLQLTGLIKLDVFHGITKGSRRKTTKTTWKIPKLTEKGIMFLRLYKGMRDLIIC